MLLVLLCPPSAGSLALQLVDTAGRQRSVGCFTASTVCQRPMEIRLWKGVNALKVNFYY